MKTIVWAMILFFSATLAGSSVWAGDSAKPDLSAASADDRISYAMGYDLYNRLRGAFQMNPKLFMQGMRDSREGEPAMSPEEVRQTLMEFQAAARKKQAEAQRMRAAVNKAEGREFLEKNKTGEGVVTLASGLQYKVLTQGSGASPKPEDTVKCHYKGTLIDGTVFDSSYQRNQPAVFPVNGVIKGWQEALPLMKVGGKWMLYIPSELAYGNKGAGNRIQPGSTLIFEVELLEIQGS